MGMTSESLDIEDRVSNLSNLMYGVDDAAPSGSEVQPEVCSVRVRVRAVL